MSVLYVDIPEAPPGPAPVGLILGKPPHLLHQQLEAAKPAEIASLQLVRALNAEQKAYFVPGTDGAESRFEFRIGPGQGHVPTEQFAVMENKYTKPSAELKEAVEDLIKGSRDRNDAIERLIEFTASLFDYDHPKHKFYEGKDEIPLLTRLTKGSCQDINTFLISSLYAAEIPAAYYSGYFFEAGKPQSSAWFHCWISTLVDGQQQDWDIAHHMKHGIPKIGPALNPVPGTRVALSHGRGLRFTVGDGFEALIPQLGQPVWVYEDGESVPAGATATLIADGENHDASSTRVREPSARERA
jgi:transglutaminase superfamily protein